MDTRPRYTIGAVSQRTGLSAHVIRAWERRHDVVKPVRTAGGARLYSAADLLRLRLLRQATESGSPIGAVAGLPLGELVALTRSADGEAGPAGTATTPGSLPTFEEPILLAIEQLDAAGIQAGLRRALAYHGAGDFVGHVVLPLLRRVGELWEDSTLCPAQEHLFSVQLRRELQDLLDSLRQPDDAPLLIATTLSGEPHELGAMLAAIVGASEGWRAAYTGPDLPPDDVATAARITGADAVLISVISPVTRRALIPSLRRLVEMLPDATTVIVGGAGAAAHTKPIEAAGALYLPDLEGLAHELRSPAAVAPVRHGAKTRALTRAAS